MTLPDHPDKRSVAVIGAGAVGVCSALHLQRRGWRVTLIDREDPGSQTSFGNAGVISEGSLVPLNNPDLHAGLLGLLRNDSAALRYRPRHLLRHAGWVLAFLDASKTTRARRHALALHTLTARALDEHRALMQRSGNAQRFSATGWLKAYRHGGAARAHDVLAGFTGEMLRRCEIEHRVLDAAALQALEPALHPVFGAGVHLVSGGVIDSPGELVAEHAARFAADGGELVRHEVRAIAEDGHGVRLDGTAGAHRYARVLIAAGPWSPDVLSLAGFDARMIVERGYHAHYEAGPGAALGHSVHDVDGGYVVGPMAGSLRVTTGVELAPRDAPSDTAQLDQIEPRLREALSVGARTARPVWRGARPSFPDGCPAIGPLPGSRRVWVNAGHQHIGLMSAPVTGRLVAEMIGGETPVVDPHPFRPERWIRRRRADHGGRFRGRRLGAGQGAGKGTGKGTGKGAGKGAGGDRGA